VPLQNRATPASSAARTPSPARRRQPPPRPLPRSRAAGRLQYSSLKAHCCRPCEPAVLPPGAAEPTTTHEAGPSLCTPHVQVPHSLSPSASLHCEGSRQPIAPRKPRRMRTQRAEKPPVDEAQRQRSRLRPLQLSPPRARSGFREEARPTPTARSMPIVARCATSSARESPSQAAAFPWHGPAANAAVKKSGRSSYGQSASSASSITSCHHGFSRSPPSRRLLACRGRLLRNFP